MNDLFCVEKIESRKISYHALEKGDPRTNKSLRRLWEEAISSFDNRKIIDNRRFKNGFDSFVKSGDYDHYRTLEYIVTAEMHIQAGSMI